MDQATFLEMPQPLRSHALVGYYLQEFAELEAAIMNTIGETVGLTKEQVTVLRLHIAFSQKVDVLRSLVSVGVTDAAVKGRLLTALKGVVDRHGADRNVIAHNSFVEQEGGDGVSFAAFRAKSQLEPLDYTWPVSKFLEEVRAMTLVRNQLLSLASAISWDRIRSEMDRFGSLGGLGGSTFLPPLPEGESPFDQLLGIRKNGNAD